MKRLVSLTVGLTLSILCFAQDESRITVSYDRAPLMSLIDQIETETSFQFYFISSWIDSVQVSVRAENAPVKTVLSRALFQSGINFFIDGNNRIILTPGIQLTSQVDSSFLSPARSTDEIVLSRLRGGLDNEKVQANQNTIIEIGRPGATVASRYTVTGYVRDRKSGEALPGALVYIKGTNYATSSDPFGFYSISIPPGRHALQSQLVGMNTVSQQVNVLGNGKLDISMDESVTQLKEVVIESDVDANVSNVQMGVSRIDMRSMKNIPKILGENDVLRVATSLPGVRTVGEGASGINVRGGHADQNLVILNEATIYNTSHFLGFFSVFHPDAIRSFELYKSGIPVQHGGRLSSTFELLMRDGNRKKVSGQGGIGPVTSQLTLEVPLIKDKTTLMVGGRTTYSNWLLKRLPETVIKNTTASFYDVFARIMHSPNDKNSIYLSLYSSHDKFSLSSDTLFSYSNRLASFQWRHVFNPNLDGVLSITRSEYNYNINYETMPTEAFNMGFSIDESNLKWEMNHSRGRHKFTGGVQAKLYELNPGFVEKSGDQSLVTPREVQQEKGIESAAFLADNIDITGNLSVYLGIRYSLFSALGPRSIYTYTPGLPRGENSIADTLNYGSNSVITNFHGPEYRASIRYKLTDAAALKASYNRTRQYIHMLSNTVSVSPTDTWKLSDPNVLPQVADQVSVGFYKNLHDEVYEFSTEVYYKWIQNILDYKTGATLLVNEDIDQQIIQGNGKAYGVELLLKKKSGKLTGWLGYAYSRTFIKLDSEIPGERINHGEYFPSNYDKPHDVNLITNYKITRRYSFSFNFAYSTGRPITVPISAYRFGNSYRVNYSDRNASRIPDYIRADLGFNIEGNHRIKKLAHSYWSISIYNILGRKNPYSIYFKVEDEKIRAYKLSIFGAPIPTITYHFKF
jgi:hypothetical protein